MWAREDKVRRKSDAVRQREDVEGIEEEPPHVGT
jgi:hypothetical protein